MNKKYNLDDYQQKAVISEYRNTLIVAAPGSGKTTVIINRIKYLIQDKNVMPERIAVITFTKAAAENMKGRYITMVKRERLPFFGTFHSLFYKILQSYYGKINIIKEEEAEILINRYLSSFLREVNRDKIKEVLSDISLYKSRGRSFDKFTPRIDKSILKECYKIYEKYKNDNKLLDFDDLQIKCKELFIMYPEILEKYRKRFDHILVDEFQDCDDLQIEMLQLLNKFNCLFAVGDEDQSIYGFRGARPDCMVEFDKYFAYGKKIFLGMNYRSPKNIISMAGLLINNNKLRNFKELRPARNVTKSVKIIKAVNENKEALSLSNCILDLMKKGGYLYRDNAVIYRTNVESRPIIDAFIKNKIPFRLMEKGYNFYEHFICKDILAYLRLTIDVYDRKSFFRVANKPYRYISRLSIERLRREVNKEDCFDFICDMEGIPLFQIKALAKLKDSIMKLNKMNLPNSIDYIMEKIGYIEYLKLHCKKFRIDFEDVKNIVDELKIACEGYSSIKDFISHVEKVSEEIRKNQFSNEKDGVILSTIHGVKGMEYSNVYIFNCNEDNIPHANSIKDNLEEERRLFYVAITRTIENLTICYSENVKGKAKKVSRFVGECNIKTC